MPATDLPLPPIDFMRRIGTPEENTISDYIQVGELERKLVLDYLPDDWMSEGKRVLDFGSGAGGGLRHFVPERDAGVELWGCDIHGPSVDWASRNLAGFTFIQNSEAPPLAVPDGYFDLVYAVSVFTHITAHWADWLIELRRVLRPGGLLIATVLGRSMFEMRVGEPFDDSKVGMMVLKPGRSWDAGGPLVFHSKWWLAAHWSPAFDLLRVDDDVVGRPTFSGAHGVVLGRRAVAEPSREAMTAPDPAEPREAVAALENVRRLCLEIEASS